MEWIKGFLLLACMLCMVACEDILEEPDISEQTVRVLAPTDGATVFGNRVNFDWEAIEEARSYRIAIALPTFSNASQIVYDTVLERDSLDALPTRILQLPLLNGNYEWRVKALNGGFETAYTTAVFTVDGDENADFVPPSVPQLLAPLNGNNQNESEVNFSWTRTDIPGTTERDSIYIYTDESLQMLQTKGLGANKTFNTTLPSNTYYWVVQAFDAAENNSEDSAVFSFTIN